MPVSWTLSVKRLRVMSASTRTRRSVPSLTALNELVRRLSRTAYNSASWMGGERTTAGTAFSKSIPKRFIYPEKPLLNVSTKGRTASDILRVRASDPTNRPTSDPWPVAIEDQDRRSSSICSDVRRRSAGRWLTSFPNFSTISSNCPAIARRVWSNTRTVVPADASTRSMDNSEICAARSWVRSVSTSPRETSIACLTSVVTSVVRRIRSRVDLPTPAPEAWTTPRYAPRVPGLGAYPLHQERPRSPA